MYIIMAILGFSLLIIVHELGHFIMAKVNGIKVEEFSIGMGPEVFSKKGKETQYSLRLFPIGGYVKMLGEEEDVEDERSFSSKSPLRRITVILAGATMNIIFAIIAFSIIISNRGYTETTISKLEPDTPAIESGLQVGDKILTIDGARVFTTTDVSMGIQLSKGDSVDLVVDRNGEKENITVTPRLIEQDGTQMYQIGFHYTPVENPTILESIRESFNETISLATQTFKSLKMMVTGNINFKTDVGGPVTIIKMSGQAAKNGLMTLTYFLGFISINLAVFNLLPFPALDGGWTVILLIELITRRKVPDKVVGAANYVGFMILIGFMIVVTLKDILFPISL
ncbi:M50 family metallopeptidase [Clostridium saudiense]|uniref:M50 family metallopeptidase n=1 Tax=Clostridium saudiense TaxID=1414720 RepID=UPI0004B8E27E|nr:M50 family metallopeptidase [Clostridium saudiense]